MRWLVAGCLSFWVGCFSPSYPEPLLCSRDAPICPTAYECDYSRGCCRPAGGACGVDPPSPSDLAVPSDLSEPSECANGGGTRLASGVWACLGKFAQGQAGSLCRHRLADSTLPASVVSECNKQLGFFVIPDLIFAEKNKSGTCVPPETQTCTWSTGVTLSYRLGCGRYKNALYRECAISCGAFYQALSCFAVYSGYTCKDAQANGFGDINLDDLVGVLCQK